MIDTCNKLEQCSLGVKLLGRLGLLDPPDPEVSVWLIPPSSDDS
jgi:hypothetical protein